MEKINPDEKQIKYWQKRNENLFLSGEKQGLTLAKNLQKNYEKCLKQIISELYINYNKYAKDGKLSLQEAKKKLDKKELKTFRQDLKEFQKYAKENNFINNEKNQLKLMQTKTKVSRLEELYTRINFELSKLTNQNQSELKSYLSDIYQNGYERTIYNLEKNIGFAISFTHLNTKLIENAISVKYKDTNYSNAIWKNKDILLTTLQESIPQGLTLGYNPKKLADITSKKLKTNYNNTVRLIRTEYNLLINQSVLAGYKQAGIEKYQILATLDNRTSEICKEMDKQIFNFKNMEVGINYPPFHPNCRTTTIPYFELDEIDKQYGIGTRLAKDENGNYYEIPANISYKEWKEKYL